MSAEHEQIGFQIGLNRDRVLRFLHPPGEYDLMAGAIVDFFRQPELGSAMGRAGRERVATQFSVVTMAQQYENLYNRVL